MIVCDEIISAMDVVSTKITNTIVSNASINYHDKKRCKFDCYILHTVSLMIISLMIIAIICFHYAKHRSKQKGIDVEQYKMENSKFKKARIENRKCYYFRRHN